MSTPARRATERKQSFETRKGNVIPIPPINPDTRTARDLAADPRVQALDIKEGRVWITLNDRWTFAEEGAPQGFEPHIRTFDLWEQARNAVRRSIGPSIRDLKAEAVAGHLDKDAG